MKRILALAVTLALLAASLSGCGELQKPASPSGGGTAQEPVEQSTFPACLTHGDDGYTLTLPQSGKTIELTEEQERFIPYITDELVAAAEKKLTQEIAGYGEHSGFYLQINEGYLCLVCEVIRYFAGSDENDEGHEHLFYDERISTRSVDPPAAPESSFGKSAVLYRSGEQEIFALSSLLWARQDNGDGTFTETVVDKYDVADLLDGNLPFPAPEIPTLLLDESVTPLVPFNGDIGRVTLFAEDEGGFTGRETTFEALSDLPVGTYYVAAYVELSGNCDPDAPQNAYRYEDVFRLEVFSI